MLPIKDARIVRILQHMSEKLSIYDLMCVADDRNQGMFST